MDSTNEDMVAIFDIENQTQEALIRSALANADIHFMITEPGELEAFQSETFHHHAKVSVLEHDAERARKLIDETLGGKA